VWRGEAVLRVAGGADPRVTDTDAFFRDRHPVLRPLPLVPDAARSARAAEEWTRWAMEILSEHEINKRRADDGLPVFNVITLKWWGRPTRVPTFLERHGLAGTFIGESAFLRGLAIAVGLETIAAPETKDAPADLAARLDLVDQRLAAGDTFVFVHQKATDAAGHTKDPTIKRDVIASLDRAIAVTRADPAKLRQVLREAEAMHARPMIGRLHCELGRLTGDDAETDTGLRILRQLGDQQQIAKFER